MKISIEEENQQEINEINGVMSAKEIEMKMKAKKEGQLKT
jgi:hypothetical protein